MRRRKESTNATRLQQGLPHSDRSVQVNLLAEKDTSGDAERGVSKVPAQDAGGVPRLTEGGTAPSQKGARAAPRAASFSHALRRSEGVSSPAQVAPADRQQDGDPGVMIPTPVLCTHHTEDAVRAAQQLRKIPSDSRKNQRGGQRKLWGRGDRDQSHRLASCPSVSMGLKDGVSKNNPRSIQI